jgi:hypothetical protein
MQFFKKIGSSLFYCSLLIGVCSCASYKYQKSAVNNTFEVYADNVSDFKVINNNHKISDVSAKSGKATVRLSKLKKKDFDFYLFNPNYDSIPIKIDRIIRPDALIKDISLGIFTFGIPLVVDVFKSDFYKISPSKKKFNVHFEYKQSFMSDEFNKIAGSKNPIDYKIWIEMYPKSILLQKATDCKDSLELSIALLQESEEAIDEFIATHNTSFFLDEAQKIKSEMVAARELFETTKAQNTVEGYENFLSKFPRSLHNKEAHRKLVNAAEKMAVNSSNLSSMTSYINKYLIPNESFLTSKEIDDKKILISKNIDNHLIKDCIKKDPKKYYENYSELWEKYNSIKSQVPKDYLKTLDQTMSYQSKICELIFNKLKESNSEEKQNQLVEKCKSDFPNLFNSNDNNFVLSVLENFNHKNGSMKLFNVGFVSHLSKTITDENHRLFEISKYDYKGQEYDDIEKIYSEELNFVNNELSGLNKCYSNSNLLFSFNFNKNFEKGDYNYYQNGKLVKSMIFTDLKELYGYYYEYENGTNITLKELSNTIAQMDLLEKSINKYWNNNSTELFNSDYKRYGEMVKELSKQYAEENQFPELKVKLEEKATFLVRTAKKIDIKNEEIAKQNEEIIRRNMEIEREIASQRRANSQNSNNYNYNSTSQSNNKKTCSTCKGTGECYQCNKKVKQRYLDERCSVRSNEVVNLGSVLCSQCFGYGYKTEMGLKCDCPNGIGSCPGETCYVCKGSGWLKCRSCNGKGECNSCKGTGERN